MTVETPAAIAESPVVAEPTALDLDALMADLADGYGRFPEASLRTCQQHRELVVPRLIEVLRDTTESARQNIAPEGNAHLFAFYLLAEFEAREAWPAILELLSLPDDWPDELLGDAITEDLQRVLAQFCSDDPAALSAMIDNNQLYYYVRWVAAQAILHLVRDGRLTRAEGVARLEQSLQLAIDRGDGEMASGIVSELASLCPLEAMPTIQRAYRLGLVDQSLIRLKSIEERLKRPDAGSCPWLENLRPTKITDAVEELRHWSAFRDDAAEDNEYDPEPLFAPVARIDDDFGGDVSNRRAPNAEDTIRYEAPKVGRNDPCPCFSGKKFKKCCLHAGSNTK
jgi:hypothetical protein